jgi:glycosyltransferase involved in cell wall biosynthesis
MAVVLLSRHGATERQTSLARLFGGIERVLGAGHRVLRVPTAGAWSASALRAWLRDGALGADLLVAASYPLLRTLREMGWRGRALIVALGELPRGAPGLRSVLPRLDGGDVVWCSSSADVAIYRTLVESGGPRVELVPFGLDDDAYRPLGPGARARLRRRWGLARSDFVMVYAGRVTVEKNVHALLEVAARLRRDGCPARLLIAGSWPQAPFEEFCLWPGDLRAHLAGLVRDAGLERHVHLLPPLDDARLNDLYNLADVFVNLTLHHDENFGYAQVEAMSAGLPVVATAWGGLKDTVRDGGTGFLADTWLSTHGVRFDLPRVVDALELLAGDAAARAELGAAAAAHARREFSPAAYGARLLALVQAALGGPGGGAPARYTRFGAAFDARFRRVGGTLDEPMGLPPVYRGFADADYAALIEPYTSRGWPRYSPGARVFAAAAGRVGDGCFVSTDVLWPGRIPLDEAEARVLRRLDRRRPRTGGDLDREEAAVSDLLKKGLAGLARDGAAGRFD